MRQKFGSYPCEAVSDNLLTIQEVEEFYLQHGMNVKVNIKAAATIIPNIKDDYAFERTGIKSINISDNLRYIGKGQSIKFDEDKLIEYNNCRYFGSENNPYLVLVDVINNDTNKIEIHNDCKFTFNDAFNTCSFVSFVVPNHIIGLGDRVFNSCYLLSALTISNSVKHVGDYLLINTINLKEITFDGTISEWRQLINGNQLTSSEIERIICTDGIIEVYNYYS